MHGESSKQRLWNTSCSKFAVKIRAYSSQEGPIAIRYTVEKRKDRKKVNVRDRRDRGACAPLEIVSENRWDSFRSIFALDNYLFFPAQKGNGI
jgi:hypothetical protein